MAAAGWLTFDLDGTVVDSPFGRLVMPRVDAHFAPALGPGRAAQLIAARQRALHAAGDRVAIFDMDGLARWVARETGVPWAGSLAALTDTLLAAGDHSAFVYGDAACALAHLRGLGWRIAAVSNGYTSYQLPVLRGLGLAHLFDAVVGPDVAGCAKPDPRIFASLGPDAVVRAHVGDLLSQDVHLARQAGVMAVWLCRGEPVPVADRLVEERRHAYFDVTRDEVRPDAVIRSLAEMAALVGAP